MKKSFIAAGLIITLLLTFVGNMVFVKHTNFKEDLELTKAEVAQVNTVLPTSSKKKVVKRLKVDVNRVVEITGVIGRNSAKIAAKIMELGKTKTDKPILVLLNSPGGSVVDGAQIISAMEASKAPVFTVCTQMCASMAAMIHSFGIKRLAVDRSVLMFHHASGGVQGELNKMMSLLTMLRRFVDKMDDNVARRSKISKEQYIKLVNDELWVDAEDALEMGLVDELVALESDGLIVEDGSGLDDKRSSPGRTSFEIHM